MPLQTITAVAHPGGNRIDLDWRVDPASPVDGVRIVRREGRYPQHPQDGVIVDDVSAGRLCDPCPFSHPTGLAAGKLHHMDARVLALGTPGRLGAALGKVPAGRHLGDHQAGPELGRRSAERCVRDPRHGCQDHVVGQRDRTDRKRL